MTIEQKDRVAELKEELLLSEKQLEELENKYEETRSKDPLNKDDLKKCKKEIKETKKVINQKKELIMILGDDEFYSEHGDVFDKFLTKKADNLEDEVTRVNYPSHGIGLVLFMEMRELYYKLKKN